MVQMLTNLIHHTAELGQMNPHLARSHPVRKQILEHLVGGSWHARIDIAEESLVNYSAFVRKSNKVLEEAGSWLAVRVDGGVAVGEGWWKDLICRIHITV